MNLRDSGMKVCLQRLDAPDFDGYEEADVTMYNEMQQMLKEKKIKTVLKTDFELLDLEKPAVKTIYILPTFRDDSLVFKHLHNIKAKIYSTFAVTETVGYNKPLPPQTPLLALTLYGAVVCFTGVDVTTRLAKTRIVEWLGGTVAKDLSRSVTQLVAITPDPRSAKYAAAMKTRLPVVKLSWIDDALHSARCYNPARYHYREIYPSYKLPVFQNLVISATGYGNERPQIIRLVEWHGGTFNGAMSKSRCTHLIAETNSGEKFQKATEWGLHVVRLEWLRKSIEMGYRLPEAKFAHNRALDTSDFSGQNPEAEPSSSSELVANNTHATPKPTPKGPKALPKKAEPVAKPVPPPQRVASLQKITSMRRSMSMRSLTEAPAAVPDPIEGVDVAKCKMSDCLEGCHLYLCGYADSALPKYKTLVRKVGATLNYEQLDAQVTHILVGTAPLNTQTTEMLKNPPGDVPVLTSRWLLDCATQADKPRRLPVDAYLYEDQTKLAEDAAAAGVKKPLNARNEDNLSSVQKVRPTGGTLGSVGGAGTQTVPETQVWRPAKSSVFQRQNATVAAAENENAAQWDEWSSGNTTAMLAAVFGYPDNPPTGDTMTTVSSIDDALTEVPTPGGRTTASNTLTLGLNRETTTTLGGRTTATNALSPGLNRETATPEPMDSSDPSLSTSNANEQTPKQSTPLAMNNRVAMLRFSECGVRRSSIGTALNAITDSMNLSHSPTEYLTGKFPFKLRLKHLAVVEQHLRDMPTPQGSPRTSTESLSVSAVGRLLEQAVVNTGRGLQQHAVAQGSDNTDQMEVDVGINNDEEEAVEAASTVTAVEPVVAAEPASPSRNRRPPNRFEHSPVKEQSASQKKRVRTPKKTPKPSAMEKSATPSPNAVLLDNDEEGADDAASTVTAVEPVVADEPASPSRNRRQPNRFEPSPVKEQSASLKKRVRTPKKTPKSSAMEKSATPSPNSDQLDNEEEEAVEAVSTVTVVEPVVAAEPASSSRKRGRKKAVQSPTECESPEEKPKRQRAARKKHL